MPQNLQDLSYEVCSTNISKIFPFSGDMRHYTPAACRHVTRIYEIRLYLPQYPAHLWGRDLKRNLKEFNRPR